MQFSEILLESRRNSFQQKPEIVTEEQNNALLLTWNRVLMCLRIPNWVAWLLTPFSYLKLSQPKLMHLLFLPLQLNFDHSCTSKCDIEKKDWFYRCLRS